MPTYEYVCTNCQNAWEEIQKISEDAITVCPKCNQSTAKRQISGGNFILKGGGWYADLYSSAKPSSGSSDSKSEGSSKSEGGPKEASTTGSGDKPAEKKPSAAPPANTSGSSSGSGSSGSKT